MSLCNDLSYNRLLVPGAGASVTTEMTSHQKCPACLNNPTKKLGAHEMIRKEAFSIDPTMYY